MILSLYIAICYTGVCLGMVYRYENKNKNKITIEVIDNEDTRTRTTEL